MKVLLNSLSHQQLQLCLDKLFHTLRARVRLDNYCTPSTTHQSNMPTAVPLANELILGRPKPLKPIDPKTRKMLYR